MTYHEIISRAYIGFNNRNTDAVLHLMQPDVAWPNGWEGGYVYGHDAIRGYWTRQWAEIDPNVTPTQMTGTAPDEITVDVHQVVNDKQGNLLADIMLKHIYTFENGLIKKMVISE